MLDYWQIDLIKRAERSYNLSYPNLRFGQALMNTLNKMNEELYREITGTEVDPFYDEEIIPAFMDYIWKI